MTSHALLCAGASPKYAATLALASGLMMWSIHRYMQFGCLASELIIQVSDQPVASSSGRKPCDAGDEATGSPSPRSVKYWYCHVVPTVESPSANDEICLVKSDQYSPTFARCCLSRSTAALNCSSSSS